METKAPLFNCWFKGKVAPEEVELEWKVEIRNKLEIGDGPEGYWASKLSLQFEHSQSRRIFLIANVAAIDWTESISSWYPANKGVN